MTVAEYRVTLQVETPSRTYWTEPVYVIISYTEEA